MKTNNNNSSIHADPQKRILIFQELTRLFRRELPEKFQDIYSRYSFDTYSSVEFDKDNHFVVIATLQGRLLLNIKVDTLKNNIIVESFPELPGDIEPLENYIINKLDALFSF